MQRYFSVSDGPRKLGHGNGVREMIVSKYSKSDLERSMERNRAGSEATRGTLHAVSQHEVSSGDGHAERGHDRNGVPERTPSFSVPGLILLGPGNALVACNNEAVGILAFPNASINAKKVNVLILEKLQIGNRNLPPIDGEHHVSELVSGRRRYICSHYVLDMHGPQSLRTTAILLDRVGNAEVTMHELCNRFRLTARERQAVGNLVKGMTSKEIAQEMGISPNTVKSFLRLVMTKAGVSTRAGLIGRVAGISMQPVPTQKIDRYFRK
jgi:DNA-binding CsgD family transcriptional regulator